MSNSTNDKILDDLDDLIREWLNQAGMIYSLVNQHELPETETFKATLLYHTVKSVAQGQEHLYKGLNVINGEGTNAGNDDNAS